MSNEHPIPKALRDRFDQIEDAICRNRMERDAVFTQMRTAVQAHFMSAEAEEGDHDGRQLEWERCENKRLREALSAARNDLLAVSHLVPGDYIPKSVASADAAIASAEQNNQCDGCRAGIPLIYGISFINGMHRMGKPGEYADLMACTSKRYDCDPDEPANKESAQ